MNDIQENQRSMARATQAVMEANNAVWSGIAGPAAIVARAQDTMMLIDANAVMQIGDSKGVTKAKSDARGLMTDRAVKVAKGGYAYANSIGDAALSGQFDIERSDLTGARDTVVTDLANTILSAGNANAAALADYNIDATDLTDLGTAISTYDGLVASTRDVRTAKSTATSNLADLFPTLMGILNDQLDPIMETFKDDNADFYKQYREARKIIDLGRKGGSGEPAV